MRRSIVGVLLLSLVLALPAASAQAGDEGTGGVLVRVDGDAMVGPDERVDVLVLVGEGTATVQGAVDVLVVVGGTAHVDDGTVGEVNAVDATVRLTGSSTVLGDVNLQQATLDRGDAATIEGTVNQAAFAQQTAAFALFGFLVFLGLGILLLLAGLVLAGIAGKQVQRAGDAMVEQVGSTLIASAILWVATPVAAVLAIATIVGLPIGLATLILVLPALLFLGYLVAGIRLGDLIVNRALGESETGHPYKAALAGVFTLLLVALVPYVGPIVTYLAGMYGAGALALVAWRALRSPARERPTGFAPTGGE